MEECRERRFSFDRALVGIGIVIILDEVMTTLRQLRQLRLPGFSRPRLEHGGSTGSGKRKEARPFTSRRPLHVILRSSQARGPWSLRRKENEAAVREVLGEGCKRFETKIYERAITGGHIHLLLRARRRELFANFLRFVSGQIAQRVTGACKGAPCLEGFWDEPIWSRVVTSEPDFQKVAAYIRLNLLETMGLVPFKRRRSRKTPGRPLPSSVQLE
jgi:REP element-mobilizing transposase RayT